MTECPRHPGAESVGTCERCGRFYCAAERIDLDLHFYCGDCGVRDDVDWLGKHYAPYLGRRSGMAWFLLVAGFVVVAFALFGLEFTKTWDERLRVVGVLVLGAAPMTVISGQAWSRWVMFASVPMAAGIFVFATGEPWAAAGAFPSLLLAFATSNDVPTRLFFRLHVGRPELRRHFERSGNNPLAVSASRLAILGLFLPGLGVATLVMGVIALTRVNSKAVPPVGNASVAVGAIIFSVFTSLIWLSAFFGMR